MRGGQSHEDVRKVKARQRYPDVSASATLSNTKYAHIEYCKSCSLLDSLCNHADTKGARKAWEFMAAMILCEDKECWWDSQDYTGKVAGIIQDRQETTKNKWSFIVQLWIRCACSRITVRCRPRQMETTSEGDHVLLLLELSEIELVLIVLKKAGIKHGIFRTPCSIVVLYEYIDANRFRILPKCC